MPIVWSQQGPWQRDFPDLAMFSVAIRVYLGIGRSYQYHHFDRNGRLIAKYIDLSFSLLQDNFSSLSSCNLLRHVSSLQNRSGQKSGAVSKVTTRFERGPFSGSFDTNSHHTLSYFISFHIFQPHSFHHE